MVETRNTESQAGEQQQRAPPAAGEKQHGRERGRSRFLVTGGAPVTSSSGSEGQNRTARCCGRERRRRDGGFEGAPTWGRAEATRTHALEKRPCGGVPSRRSALSSMSWCVRFRGAAGQAGGEPGKRAEQ